LWLYYHRLDKDILFKVLLNYVEPKIRLEQSRLDSLRSQKTALGTAAKGAKKIDKDIERQDTIGKNCLKASTNGLQWASCCERRGSYELVFCVSCLVFCRNTKHGELNDGLERSH
jgi:hypothetical protein